MIFKDKKIRESIHELEHKVQTLENINNRPVNTINEEEMRRDIAYLNGTVRALLDYLEVYPTKELVVDTRYRQPETPMVEVFKIKSNKVKK